MIKVEHSIIVPRSVEEVFSFLGNFEQDPHWQSGILEAKQMPAGAALVGTTVKQVRHFLGRRLDYTGEVIEYEENKKIWVKSISGPYPFEGGYTLEPVDGGTKVTFLLRVCEKIRSWFDMLTTNGMASMGIQLLSRSS